MLNRNITVRHTDVISRHSALLAFACLLFFSCYTLTPLYHPGPEQGGENDQLADQDHQQRTVRMLLLDLVVTRLALEENNASSPITVHVLLKKRRAVLNSGAVPDVSPESSYTLIEDLSAQRHACLDIPSPISSSGSLSRYSGLSPPPYLASPLSAQVMPLLQT